MKDEEDKKKGVLGFFSKRSNNLAGSSTSQIGGSPKSRGDNEFEGRTPPDEEEDSGDDEQSDHNNSKMPNRYGHLANTLKKKKEKPKEETVKDRDGIWTIDDLKDLKYLMQDKKYGVGIPLNTNILRIALNFQEEKIAR